MELSQPLILRMPSPEGFTIGKAQLLNILKAPSYIRVRATTNQPTYQQLQYFSISTRALIELLFNNLPHLPTTVQTLCMPTLPLLYAYPKLYQNSHCFDTCRLRLHPIKENEQVLLPFWPQVGEAPFRHSILIMELCNAHVCYWRAVIFHHCWFFLCATP